MNNRNEFIWVLVGLLSGYIAFQSALYFSHHHDMLFTGIYVVGVFILCSVVLGGLVWFIFERQRFKKPLVVFHNNPEGAVFEVEDGASIEFLWSDIKQIEIITTDKGPFEEDAWWSFYSQELNAPIIIPQGDKHKNKIISAVTEHFEGSDEYKMQQAIMHCFNDRFVIWQAPGFNLPTSRESFFHELAPQSNDQTERHLHKNTWVGAVFIIMIFLVFGGYLLVQMFAPQKTLMNDLALLAFPVFVIAQIAEVMVYIYSAYLLQSFLNKHPKITGQASLEALKPVVRRCMILALVFIGFFLLSMLCLAMIFMHWGSVYGTISSVILGLVAIIFPQWYDPKEKGFKQIECTDPMLENELQTIFNSWEKDGLPKF